MSVPRKKSVTAKDIARLCGISQATVSYVINNKEGKKISDATRQLVLQTAERLNYVPNSTARSMRTHRAMSIGVVSGKNNLTVGFSRALSGIKNFLDTSGYSITLLNDDDAAESQHEYVRYYRSSRIDGILFLFYDMADSTMEMLCREKIPFFLVDESGVWCSPQQSHTLLEEGIFQAASLCRRKNFQRICFFSSQWGETLFSRKWDLFSHALSVEYPQVEMERCIVQTRGVPIEELMSHFQSVIGTGKYDAVITANPRAGWMVQSAILQRDFSIPMSVRHICLAASGMFTTIYPTITCLDMPLEDMGEYAARQIIRLLSDLPVEEQSFSCALKEGISTL